ncbi:MAG: hypothetical protein ACRYFS_19855 [Janthinobacterium lividum]
MTTLRAAVRPTNACTVQIGDFRLIRRGRFWAVQDALGALVVTAVYKKGAIEVVRRLLPPEKRHLADEVKRKRLTTSPLSPHCRYNTNHNNAHSRDIEH